MSRRAPSALTPPACGASKHLNRCLTFCRYCNMCILQFNMCEYFLRFPKIRRRFKWDSKHQSGCEEESEFVCSRMHINQAMDIMYFMYIQYMYVAEYMDTWRRRRHRLFYYTVFSAQHVYNLKIVSMRFELGIPRILWLVVFYSRKEMLFVCPL